MNMLGANTSLGSQRCNASNGEALLNTATELMGKSSTKRKDYKCIPLWERASVQTVLPDTPLSRASSLPQGTAALTITCRLDRCAKFPGGIGRIGFRVVDEVGHDIK